MRGKLDYQYTPANGTLKTVTDEFEKNFITKIMQDSGYDKYKAAQALDIDVSWLYKKLKKYGITEDG